MTRVFLTAEWRHLLMINYAVAPEVLAPYVPDGVELDFWQDTTYVSLVGFLFRDTRVLGIPIPWHRTFEEVNLRIYVRRTASGEVRRGVTFIREIVPRRAIATVARLAYNEPYVSAPMRHTVRMPDEAGDGDRMVVAYEWRFGAMKYLLHAEGPAALHPLDEGSHEEFIAEHYWGYTRQRDGSTVEYRVEHPRWRAAPATHAKVIGDMTRLYGPVFARILGAAPVSVFVADGSPVRVYAPAKLETRR